MRERVPLFCLLGGRIVSCCSFSATRYRWSAAVRRASRNMVSSKVKTVSIVVRAELTRGGRNPAPRLGGEVSGVSLTEDGPRTRAPTVKHSGPPAVPHGTSGLAACQVSARLLYDCAASSSLIFSRSRSVTSRRNREFSSWSLAIRSPPRRSRSGLPASWVATNAG
jgi:hypothetical protein